MFADFANFKRIPLHSYFLVALSIPLLSICVPNYFGLQGSHDTEYRRGLEVNFHSWTFLKGAMHLRLVCPLDIVYMNRFLVVL